MNHSPETVNLHRQPNLPASNNWFKASIILLCLLFVIGITTAEAHAAAPTITSPSNVNVNEFNYAVIDVEATDDLDAEGSGLSFSLTGGDDQGLFVIDPNNGVVRFDFIPVAGNFKDANDNGTYEFQVTVTDSSGESASQNIGVFVQRVTPTARTWHIDNLRLDSGAVVSGSFRVAVNTDSPVDPEHPDPSDPDFLGYNTVYGFIDVTVTQTNGSSNHYVAVNPASRGNSRYVSLVTQSSGDLTGTPFLALTPHTDMTNSGGIVNVQPGPQFLSYQGVCRQANCGPADPPYEEALAGGTMVAGPRVWAIENVQLDSGATISGHYTFDPDYPEGIQDIFTDPDTGETVYGGTFYDINIQVTQLSGATNTYVAVNPASRGNHRYLSLVTQHNGNLAGTPFLALTPAFNLTAVGGRLDVLPGPQNLSYQGVCRLSNCGPADAPYEEALAGGSVVANYGPQTWYIEGLRFDTGETGSGSYKYDPITGQYYQGLSGFGGNYSEINVQVTQDGNTNTYIAVNPVSQGNREFLFFVTQQEGDLSGTPLMALSLASPMTNVAGPIQILPGPQDLSYQGFCNGSNCGSNMGPYDEANLGGRVTRVVAPPVITSSATVNAAENQTSVIDMTATDNLDSEGNGLVYSKSGGADQALFNLDTTTGVITFINAPDFETPGDAGGDNTYNLQVTLTDLGGRTAVQDLIITVTDVVEDTTAPVSNPAFDPAANAAGWNNSDVTVNWNWTDEDGGSGIDTSNCEQSFTFLGTGAQATVGQCSDLAGNLGLQGSGSINIDRTAPVSTAVITPMPNAAGWNNSDVTINWNWADEDGGSGLNLASCELSSTLSGEGPLAIVGQCKDVAENLGLQGSGSINIDKTAPDTAITVTPAANNTTGEATFEFMGIDLTSGVAGFECTMATSVANTSGPCSSPQNYAGLPNDNYTFSVRAIDTAGNSDQTASSFTFTVDIPPPDTTAPVAEPSFSPAANAANWHNTDVTVNFNWSDPAEQLGELPSGIDQSNCVISTQIIDREGSDVTFGGGCVDLAGNVGEYVGSVLIDKTAPETTLTSTPPANSTSNEASFVFSGSDSLSGVAGYTCELSNDTVALGDACTSPHVLPDLANGNYTFSVRAIDVAGNVEATAATHTWTVNVNTAPTLNGIGNQSIAEGELLQFGVTANDVDGDNLSIAMSNGPSGSILADNGDGTATFSWSPEFDQAGSYSDIVFTVTDDGQPSLNSSEAISITVSGTNTAPTLNTIGNRAGSEGELLQFDVSATDNDGDNLSFTVSNAPTGATFSDNGNGTATFSWTPEFDQAGSYSDVVFTVTDDGQPSLNSSEAISITVGGTNIAPTLAAIGNQSANEGEQLAFTVSAADDDGDNLVFAMSNAPTGATLADNGDGTATFSWNPDFDQAGNYTDVVFTVTDDGQPSLSDNETISIVVNGTNTAPTLGPIGNQIASEGQQLQLTVNAIDTDGDSLAFTLSNAPTGATLVDNGDGTATFNWTPEFNQAGNYTDVLFTVTDDGQPQLAANETITITVGNTNRPPQFSAASNQTTDEGVQLVFEIQATDVDGDQISLAMANEPTGATFVDGGNGNGTLTWTPGFGQSGNYTVMFTATDNGTPAQTDTLDVMMTVGNVNQPPVLEMIGARTADEGVVMSFLVSAADADGDSLAFALANAPAGATLTDNGNGTANFAWVPGFDQAGNFTDVLFTVTDNGSPQQADSEMVTLTVGNVNRPPVLNPVGDRTAQEGMTLTITLTSSDADGNNVSFAQPVDLPAGATLIDNNDGTAIFNWTPGFEQAGNYPVTFEINDDGDVSEGDMKVVAISVGNVNRAPTLNPIGDQTVEVGSTLAMTLTSSDPDGDALSYVVPTNLPTNATVIDNSDGTASLSWTPTADQVGMEMVSIVVNDNGSPIESAAEVVTVTVTAAPVITPATPATPAMPAAPASSGGGGGSLGVIDLLLGLFLLSLIRRRALAARGLS